jgi:putative phosphoserine phosphatase/1-acylglycerol-3-phosphate O-acyltransferase
VSIAFFDFDGTLLRRDSGVICAVPSIGQGLLGPRIGTRLIFTYLLSKAGLRTRTDAQRVGFECYAGRSLDQLRTIMTHLHENHLRAWVSPAMRREVDRQRAEGARLVVLTASAFFFAEPLARELELDEVLGTQVAFSDGLCTGRVDGQILEGEAKLAAARAYAEARSVPLSACTFYTDHVADLPLLEAVGAPVAVGPNRALARVARARGWPIVQHGGAGSKLVG